MPIKRQH